MLTLFLLNYVFRVIGDKSCAYRPILVVDRLVGYDPWSVGCIQVDWSTERYGSSQRYGYVYLTQMFFFSQISENTHTLTFEFGVI